MKEWVKTLKKQHVKLVRQWEALEQQESEAAGAVVDIKIKKWMQKPRRDVLQETLLLGGQWMVILYNAAELHFIQIAHCMDPLQCMTCMTWGT